MIPQNESYQVLMGEREFHKIIGTIVKIPLILWNVFITGQYAYLHNLYRRMKIRFVSVNKVNKCACYSVGQL